MHSTPPPGRAPSATPRAVALAGALLAVVFLLLFGRAHGYGYVWDDSAITDSPAYAVSLWEGLTATQHDHLGIHLDKTRMVAGHDSYRPLMYLSYRTDVAVFGMRAGPMHVHNVLLGLLIVGLVYWTAVRWFLSPMWAMAAAALFALHPLQVEPVAYVSGRGDLLAAGFGLACVLSTLHAVDAVAGGRARVRGTMLSVVFFLASLFSKEAYIGLPAVIALVVWSRGPLGRSHLLPLASLVVTLLCYLGLRVAVAGAGTGVSPLDGVAALPGIVLDYLGAALLPLGLSTERLYDHGMTPPGWGLLVAVLVAGWLSMRASGTPSAPRRLARRLVAAYGWVFILVGPSALIVLLHGVSADRYMYLPLFGFCVAVAAVAEAFAARVAQAGRVVRLGIGVALAMYVAIDLPQVAAWHDDMALYSRAVRYSPDSTMAHYRLGYVHARAGRCDLAMPYFQRALALSEDNARARNNMGVCLLNAGHYPEAARALRQVVASDPTHYRSHLNLGLALLGSGDRAGACKSFQQALWINPLYNRAKQAFATHCGDLKADQAP